jgi:hypothetical protein
VKRAVPLGAAIAIAWWAFMPYADLWEAMTIFIGFTLLFWGAIWA